MREIAIFLLGAAFGAIAALLFAPSSGAELRSQVQTAAEENLERFQAEWEQGLKKTNEKLDTLQADLKQAMSQGESEIEEAV